MSQPPATDDNLKPLSVDDIEYLIDLYSNSYLNKETVVYVNVINGEITTFKSESVSDYSDWYELNDEEFAKLKNDYVDEDITNYEIWKNIYDGKNNRFNL